MATQTPAASSDKRNKVLRVGIIGLGEIAQVSPAIPLPPHHLTPLYR
jgi:hypothetical protein